MSRTPVQGRPWTPHEDKLLIEAVRIHGDNTEKWKTIALSVPGRTNKACRKRWLHSLSPNVKKSAWTPEEDRQLLSLFEKYPNKWSQIARGIPGRTDDACSKRYREALDPKLKKDDWTEEEDRRLLDSIARHTTESANPKWVLIGQELSRSSLGCRNRWRLLERKKNAAAREQRNAPSQLAGDSSIPRFLAETWPTFPENDSGASWTGAWELLNFCAPNANVGVNLDLLTVNTGIIYPPVATMNSAIVGQSIPLCAPAELNSQTVLPPSLTTYATSGSTLSSVLSEIQEARREMQTIEQTSGTEVVSGDGVHSQNLTHLETDSNSSHDDPPPSAGTNDVETELSHDVGQASETSSRDPFGALHRNTTRDVGGSQSVFRISYTNQNESFRLSSLIDAGASAASPCSPGTEYTNYTGTTPRARKRRRTGEEAGASIQVVTVSVPGVGREQKPPKLSSTLPVASNPSVLAYVCGHSACWRPGSVESNARFATSGELHNHFKETHLDDSNGGEETPFRCGLKDCKKAWKSINGLQYHLQISKSHYQRILSTVIPSQAASSNNPQESVAVEKTKRKLHKCLFPNCPSSYKQLSGLRYHLLHGHPKNPPAQLDSVPPAIARRFGVEVEAASS